jgi:fatty acid desaturase
MREWLTRDEIAALRAHRPGPLVRATVLAWTAVGTVVWACGRWPSAWTWAIGAVLVGIAQNAVQILLHEAAHGLVHPDRRRNDLVADWFFAAPLLVTVESYRKRHLEHHWHLATARDTKRYPREHVRGWRIVRHAALALGGVYAGRMAANYVRESGAGPPARRAAAVARVAAVQAAIAAAAWSLAGPWAYPVLWLLPIFTVMTLIVSTRTKAEHQPAGLPDSVPDDEGILEVTRTVVGNAFSRLVIAPFHFNLHHEHHLYPFVPGSSLPRVHALLRARGYYDENPGRLARGYASVLRGLVVER